MRLIDAEILKQRLKGQADSIFKVLTALQLEKIRDHKNGQYFSCCRPGGNNPNGVLLYTETLVYIGTTSGRSGNIFTLVMDVRSCSFPESLRFIVKTLGIQNTTSHITLPFGGFYRNLRSYDGLYVPQSTYYDPQILPPANRLSQRYFDDGVDFQTQQRFGIRLSLERDEIWIPQKDTAGNLVGVKSRSNRDDCPPDRRFYAPYPYAKTNVLYGYCENYHSIVSAGTVVIFEAEKSVCQAYSFGMNKAIAIEGHSISQRQARLIKGLGAKNIIVAFDSDICGEEAEFESKKLLLKNMPFKNRVFFINDSKEQYIRKADKVSPSDLGRPIFEKLAKECLVRVKE